jgi:hypothetical protein
MRGHHLSEWAGEPMSDDRPGRDADLERKLARLAEEFDPVPSSVRDDARAALSARTRAGRAARSPEPASESRDPAFGSRDS